MAKGAGPKKGYVDLPGSGGNRSGRLQSEIRSGQGQASPSESDGYDGKVKCDYDIPADTHTYTNEFQMRKYSQDGIGFDHGTDGDEHLGRDHVASRMGHKG